MHGQCEVVQLEIASEVSLEQDRPAESGQTARDIRRLMAALEECSSPLSAAGARPLAFWAGSDTD
jgi:hypothetical protein